MQWATAEDLQRVLATLAVHAHLAGRKSLAETIQSVFYRVEYVGA